MALNAFQLFLNQIQSAPERLKLKVVQVVFDISLKWEKEILGSTDVKLILLYSDLRTNFAFFRDTK